MHGDPARWNHNIQYHPLVLAAVPPGCRRALDVGCGEGQLTRELRRRVDEVVGLDPDGPGVALARAQAGPGLSYVVGDVLMMCRVRLNRHVHACRVLIEQPKGYGLGMAAVQASEMFRVLPADRGGRPIDDAWVGVPVHYDLTAHKH